MDYTISPTRRLPSLHHLLQLMRPKQWVKNMFVFMPLIFSGQFLQVHQMQLACIAFFAFCLLSSSTYIMNDINDVEQDKLHPIKSKTRPLASGNVSLLHALIAMSLLYIMVCFICLWLPALFFPICTYGLLNVLYTFNLKHEPVLDIFIIAIGFVLRIVAGAMAIHVPLSAWMLITSLSLALYLAAIKRRQELLHHQINSRKSLEKYTLPLIEKYAQLSATCAIMFYSLFVITSKTKLVMTIPLTLFGIFRYWYIVESLEQGESPTDILFEDWPLSLTVLVWGATCIWMEWPA